MPAARTAAPASSSHSESVPARVEQAVTGGGDQEVRGDDMGAVDALLGERGGDRGGDADRTDGSQCSTAAASMAPMPSTDWRYWVVKSAEPIMAKDGDEVERDRGAEAAAAEQGRGRSSGRHAVRWRWTKSAREDQADGDRDDVRGRSSPRTAISLMP